MMEAAVPDLALMARACLIGLISGALSGGFGIGGGIVCTPLARLFLNVNPYTAVGTTLAMVVPTAVSGALNYFKQNMICPRLALFCTSTAVFGTICGSLTTSLVDGHLLMLGIAAILGLTGIDFASGLGERLKARYAISERMPSMNQAEILKSLFVGLFTGFLSGLLGVGGGFVLVPCFLYLFGTSIKMAFGTSLLVIAACAVPGTVVHALSGHVDFYLTLALVSGAIPGAWLGSMLSLKLRDSWLRIAFGVLLLCLSLSFALREGSQLQEMPRDESKQPIISPGASTAKNHLN